MHRIFHPIHCDENIHDKKLLHTLQSVLYIWATIKSVLRKEACAMSIWNGVVVKMHGISADKQYNVVEHHDFEALKF